MRGLEHARPETSGSRQPRSFAARAPSSKRSSIEAVDRRPSRWSVDAGLGTTGSGLNATPGQKSDGRVSSGPALARLTVSATQPAAQPKEKMMPSQKYLLLLRSPMTSEQQPPSPAKMQEMFAVFNAWKEKFKDNILDMGGKLKPGGKVLTASGVLDGPLIEAKEIVGGYMIITAESYDRALEVAKEGPGMMAPGTRIEIREIGRS
jgi:hypothetical protein